MSNEKKANSQSKAAQAEAKKPDLTIENNYTPVRAL